MCCFVVAFSGIVHDDYTWQAMLTQLTASGIIASTSWNMNMSNIAITKQKRKEKSKVRKKATNSTLVFSQ